ncbi:ribonuclease HI family protein [Limosilactobacillus difficilis]|uniref:ribonuclease HI family protein n=1 Tax=Limosilactobacillus difficilis TaxID=2991838 RepID=UPI0024B898D4|nr:ribonuclease HI family protein [Limosilactobacillus difficilis]
MIKMYTDAATKGNPGPTGLGILILHSGQQLQLTGHLTRASNHEGEFAAAQQGFTYLVQHGLNSEPILFYTDSRLLSDAIGKTYSKHYQAQLQALLSVMNQTGTVVTQWIPEKKNHGAHHLANQALHRLEKM